MNKLPYSVFITYIVGDELTQAQAAARSFRLELPAFFSKFKYFKLKLRQCDINVANGGELYNKNLWLCSESMSYNKIINSTDYGDNSFSGQGNFIFNLSTFLRGGCMKSDNYEIELPYKNYYDFNVRNYLYYPITNIRIDLIIDLIPI